MRLFWWLSVSGKWHTSYANLSNAGLDRVRPPATLSWTGKTPFCLGQNRAAALAAVHNRFHNTRQQCTSNKRQSHGRFMVYLRPLAAASARQFWPPLWVLAWRRRWRAGNLPATATVGRSETIRSGRGRHILRRPARRRPGGVGASQIPRPKRRANCGDFA